PRLDSSSAWATRPAIASGEGWFTTGYSRRDRCGCWRGCPYYTDPVKPTHGTGMTAKTGRQRRSGARRWLRWLWKLPLLLLALSVLQVVALRFVDPPFSAFMAARQLQAWGDGDRAFRVAYDWRDLDRIAPSLPVSMIAAEDQNFASHRGFDFEAI